MSHFEESQGGGWLWEVPEERPALVHAWVKTELAWREGTLIRCCDSTGCTGCGSPAFTKRCFFRGKVLPKAVSTRWAGSKQMLLLAGQSWRAVCSCYLLFWQWGDAQALMPCPSLSTLPAQLFCNQLFCNQLFSVWHYWSPLFWWLRLKYLVADYAKYLLFITMSFCVETVLSLQYGFNVFWILYANCFYFSVASSLGHFNFVVVIAALSRPQKCLLLLFMQNFIMADYLCYYPRFV